MSYLTSWNNRCSTWKHKKIHETSRTCAERLRTVLRIAELVSLPVHQKKKQLSVEFLRHCTSFFVIVFRKSLAFTQVFGCFVQASSIGADCKVLILSHSHGRLLARKESTHTHVDFFKRMWNNDYFGLSMFSCVVETHVCVSWVCSMTKNTDTPTPRPWE